MRKGFTLIELLVVIAIIAVLAVVVILTLNPAELLRQARDSNRVSDLSTVKRAIALFLVETSSSTGLLGGNDANYGKCYTTSAVENQSACNLIFSTSSPTTLVATTTPSAAPSVDGTGWIPVNLTAIQSGSPISNFPVDPINSGDNIYFYRASSTFSGYKLAGKLESLKLQILMQADGGLSGVFYEVGTDLKL